MKNLCFYFQILLLVILSNPIEAQPNSNRYKYNLMLRMGPSILYGDLPSPQVNWVSSLQFAYNLPTNLMVGFNYHYGVFQHNNGDEYGRTFRNNFNILSLGVSTSLPLLIQQIKGQQRVNHIHFRSPFDMHLGLKGGMMFSSISQTVAIGEAGVNGKNTSFTASVDFDFLYNLKPNISFLLGTSLHLPFSDELDGYAPVTENNQYKDSFAMLTLGASFRLGDNGKTPSRSPSRQKPYIVAKKINRKKRKNPSPKKSNSETSTIAKHNTREDITPNTTTDTTLTDTNKSTTEGMASLPALDTWILEEENEGVEIFYMWPSTRGKVVIKVLNTNAHNVRINLTPVVVCKQGKSEDVHPARSFTLSNYEFSLVDVDFNCRKNLYPSVKLDKFFIRKVSNSGN